MTKAVVVDSDASFALYNPNDPLNVKTVQTFEQFIALRLSPCFSGLARFRP
jgi:hypothetical protein